MDTPKKTLDFLDISPYVRYAHRCLNADQNNHQIPWRYIYDYEFLYISDGCIQLMTDSDSYVLSQNHIHIIPPMVWHRMEIPYGKSCSYYSVHFDFINLGRENDFSPEEIYIAHCNTDMKTVPVNEKLLRRPLYVLGSLQLPKKIHINDPIAYTMILNNVIQAQSDKPFAYEIDLKCNMLLLLKQILNDVRLGIVGIEDSRTDNLSAIIQYVLDHYDQQISFEVISHVYGYSYSNFRKLFKQKSGKSPNEFSTDIRIEKAVELLYSRKYTISEISYMVGYEDSAYFSRVFRQKKGCSPSCYVKA